MPVTYLTSADILSQGIPGLQGPPGSPGAPGFNGTDVRILHINSGMVACLPSNRFSSFVRCSHNGAFQSHFLHSQQTIL